MGCLRFLGRGAPHLCAVLPHAVDGEAAFDTGRFGPPLVVPFVMACLLASGSLEGVYAGFQVVQACVKLAEWSVLVALALELVVVLRLGGELLVVIVWHGLPFPLADG